MASSDMEFDYVIVGAGSAGCVLANRLSEDASVSVCVIEAGKRDNSLLVRMPAGVGPLIKQKGPYNWGFDTVPQVHMDNRSLYWPRGRGLGGSSSINGMVYIRGHARDYDQWRQMGLSGWGYDDVLPYFKRAEHYDGAASEFHGLGGPLWVEDSPLSSPVHRAFIEAGRQAGYPYTPDFNGAQQEGVGPYQRTIKDGERWSASFGYLHPVMGVRPNLTVKTTGLVSRILFDGTQATGVEMVPGKRRQAETVRARREVIVCAGAVQSPQLLQLSGIGDSNLLSRFGIQTVVEHKEVGQNLQDHLDVSLVYEMTKPLSAYSTQKGLKKLAVGLDYMIRKQGPGRDQFLQTGAFLKSREGLDRPDIQLHMVLAAMLNHARDDPGMDGFTVHACQLRPESRGTVLLGSPDPFDAPLIDPNYLAVEEDRRVMREAVRMTREICQQEALGVYRGPEMRPGASVQSDAEIDTFIRTHGETIYHPVGTVRMGTDEAAPVDGELRVRGTEGLRVVDASVMPTLVGGNTNAPTIMVAEKAADMILGRSPLQPADVTVAA